MKLGSSQTAHGPVVAIMGVQTEVARTANEGVTLSFSRSADPTYVDVMTSAATTVLAFPAGRGLRLRPYGLDEHFEVT